MVGRSWGPLNASCWLGGIFDVGILELKADGPDILAVGEIVYMLCVAVSRLEAVLALTRDDSLVVVGVLKVPSAKCEIGMWSWRSKILTNNE